MKHYLLKCIYEGKDIAFLDIQVNDQNTLEELHTCLIKAVGFSGKQMASFYCINEDFEIIEEIPVDQMSGGRTMKEVPLKDLIEEVGDQLLYTYDFMNEYKFTFECMELLDSPSVPSPLVIKKHGTFPKEQELEMSNEEAEAILLNAILGDEFEDEDEQDDDLFESLDDYEDLI